MIPRTARWRRGRRIVRPCGAAAFLFLTAGSVSGQQPGDRVRVALLERELVDVVVEADSSGLFLSAGYAPYAAMETLELSVGTKRQAWRGFKTGLFVGGGLGVATGLYFAWGIGANDDEYPLVGLLFGAVGGVGAGLIGALIGALVESHIWEPVPIPGGLSIRLAVW